MAGPANCGLMLVEPGKLGVPVVLEVGICPAGFLVAALTFFAKRSLV